MIEKLFVSNVVITEDEYSFKSSFTLTKGKKILSLDINDLDSNEKLGKIKETFGLDEPSDEIRKHILEKVMEHASLNSRNVEGKEYIEKDGQKKDTGNLDMA